MKKSVVFLEVEGGNDKGPDGHRKDTMPMIEAICARGWDANVIYYSNERFDELLEEISEVHDAYISRINPGHIPGGEARYFELLRALSDRGVIGMPHPDAMIAFGAKDALVKLTDTGLVPEDTYAYYEMDDFRAKFPEIVSTGIRVLKQNRGSTGSGIWRVEVIDDREFAKGEALPEDAKLKCTEAVDNHVEERTLGDFMEFCDQYLVGEGGMIVDMPFFPRIKEGEIRILYVGAEPVFVVHKKPAEAEDAFSATLFSGAKYTYDDPADWDYLVNWFGDRLPDVREKLGGHDTPLIWTADFMLDDGPEGNDIYVLGEINCSCVGFTSHLDRGIQDQVATEIIRVVEEKKG